MNSTNLSRIVASALLLLVAIFIGLGSKALWNGRPSDWPDLTATDEVVITASRWALVIAAVFVVCAIGVFLNAPWAFIAVATVLALALVVLFWGHYVLFGKWDPAHAGINVFVAMAILLLLWKGTQEN